jgi:ATP-dependent exoDNAse (exonuclease V) beta subunit
MTRMTDNLASGRPDDWPQRQAALDPGRSFIVQAPAGSGKTGLLTQRFLRLLATVESPEEIIAITFTRKAAAEMRGRILQALADAQSAPGDHGAPADHGAQAADCAEDDYARQTRELANAALAHARARDWRLLENPQRLRVRTIDSLCQYLARQMPLGSGFGDPPGIEEDAAELYRAAARSVLAELESVDPLANALADALATLLGELDNRMETVQELVADMLGRREQWLRHLFADNSRESIEGVLRSVVEAQLMRLREAFPADAAAALPALIRYAADNLGPDHALAVCRELRELPAATVAGLPAWSALADLLLTQQGAWRKGIDKRNGFPAGAGAPAQAKQAMCELLDGLRGGLHDGLGDGLHDESGDNGALAALLHGLRHLPDPGYADDEWQLIQALFTVLKGGVAHLGVVFMEQGRVDFSETALAAQRALGSAGEPSELALRLDYQVRHLLVDEFQDTSRSQHDLFALLTAGWQPGDGRTLFLVGDPMQSIYRFRQAEVGLFLDAWQGRLGGVALEPLRLSVNFRSRSGIIDWVNRHFAQVLPSQPDKERGAVPYAPSRAFRPAGEARSGPDPGPGAVTVHPFIGRADAAETARILTVIHQARAADPAGTTAVLVRSKAHLEHLIVALRGQGLRFQAVEIGPLQYRPAVMDLLSLTLALLHPADRLHWLALLHGPLCGLELEDLHRLTGADREDHAATVPSLLADARRVARLATEGGERAARVWSVLEVALENRERAPLRDWIEGAWLTLGGPLCLPDAAATEDVEVFFSFLQTLGDSGRAATPERVRDGAQRLFALPDPLADERLQLMTIHKAKGLEFDTVILPGLGRPPRGDSRKLLYWLATTAPDGSAELFFGPVKPARSERDPPTSAYIKRLEAEMDRLESGRLLYVAATRAKRSLHLLGHAGEKADGELAVNANSLLSPLWPAVQGYWEALRDGCAGSAVAEEPPAGYAAAAAAAWPPWLRVPAGWSCPAPPPRVGAVREADAEAGDAVVYEWAGDAARAVGIVVHRFLQLLGHERQASLDALPGFEAAARRLLLTEGLPQQQVGPALQRVRTALQRTLADSRGQWILSAAHAECHNERSVTAVIGGRPRRLVIDRTFVDADGVRWIIDYKTGRHEGGNVEGFLDQEQERYRAQLAAYASAFRALEDRPVRTALYYPLVAGGWREVETPHQT